MKEWEQEGFGSYLQKRKFEILVEMRGAWIFCIQDDLTIHFKCEDGDAGTLDVHGNCKWLHVVH